MSRRRTALGGLVTTVLLLCSGFVAAQPAAAAGAAWRTVDTGHVSTCGIRVDGTLWCWGYNGSGQFGDGGAGNESAVPTQIGTRADWARLSAGDEHTCAIRVDGSLWCWGWNALGQVGDGTRSWRVTPVQVGAGTTWTAVSVSGSDTTCAVRSDATLWCWGDNHLGMLGIGQPDPGRATFRLRPTQVLGGAPWASVEVGEQHVCGVRTDITLWCWGNNIAGQLGTGDLRRRWRPAAVGTATGWTGVSAGYGHTCATRSDTTLWCWGGNGSGELGLGDTTNRRLPHKVATDAGWTDVSAGSGFTCAIRTDGRLWCWGRDDLAQLGSGPLAPRDRPAPVGTLAGWTTVTTGETFTACGVRSGTALCWGWNLFGQVGDGTEVQRNLPTPVAA